MKSISQLILLFSIMMFSSTILAQEGIKLDLKEARAIGNELHIDFLLVNEGTDVEVYINFAAIKLYDIKGNVYNAKRVVFAQKEVTYGGATQSCIQGIPMKLKLVFAGAPSKLLLVKSLMFKINRKSDNKDFLMKYDNLIIPTSPNKLVMEALADSLFLEVAPSIFARMTSVARNQKEVLISFIVLNTANDQNMYFGFKNTRIIDNLGNSMNLKGLDFSGKAVTYGGLTVEMPQAVPMKLIYKFELIDPSASEIKIFEFTSGAVKYQLRDISLSGLITH